MATVDRQIVGALDQIHSELAGAAPCRWEYKGIQDTYKCSHLKLTGREVIDKVESFNYFKERVTEWESEKIT